MHTIKYKKISKGDVFRFITANEVTINWYPMYFSANLIARCLNTSYYQANKYLKQLNDEGLIEYGTMPSTCTCYSYQSFCECEPHIPINGYVLTEKGKKIT